MSSLIGSRAKIGRANEQIDVLGAQFQSAMEPDSRKLLVEWKKDVYDGHPAITTFVTQVPVFSTEISILIGEIVHNLRSSLDPFAWALVPPGVIKAMRARNRRQIAFLFLTRGKCIALTARIADRRRERVHCRTHRVAK